MYGVTSDTDDHSSTGSDGGLAVSAVANVTVAASAASAVSSSLSTPSSSSPALASSSSCPSSSADGTGVAVERGVTYHENGDGTHGRHVVGGVGPSRYGLAWAPGVDAARQYHRAAPGTFGVVNGGSHGGAGARVQLIRADLSPFSSPMATASTTTMTTTTTSTAAGAVVAAASPAAGSASTPLAAGRAPVGVMTAPRGLRVLAGPNGFLGHVVLTTPANVTATAYF